MQTSVSISQMLKGSVLFFTYLITLFYLKRTLTVRKHLFMGLILLSLTIIGSANLKDSTSKCNHPTTQSNPIRCSAMRSSSSRSCSSA
jgi:drug/metabolite transporter (DMT)-like permease